MNKDNEIDDLFKRKLEDPVGNNGYNEGHWEALERMLDKRKRRGVIYWLPILGSAAALLLLFFGYLALRRGITGHNPQNNRQAVNHPKAHSGINGGSIRQQTDHSPKTLTAAVIADNSGNGKRGGDHKAFLPLSAAGSRRTAGFNKPVVNDTALYDRSGEALSAKSPRHTFGDEQVVALPVSSISLQHKAAVPALENKQKRIVTKKLAYRSQFALSVIAAPDINGVGSFEESKVGTNEGLLFSAGISKRLTLSTGAIYSVKPYITGFENYHTIYQFQVDPVNVMADCRMLDIPLNIGYQVYNKYQNKISFGTGLSSYIMLHESYKFNYASPYTTGPTQFTVPGVNKYFLGVLNLNATFQHQVNSKVGFSVQPYMKLPLTNIGYSQVRLQTTGVALGLTWNLNSLSKP